MPEVHAGSYKEAILFLVTAGIVVPLFHRLRISPVLGFIGAGALLGPFGLGRFAQQWPSFNLFTIGNRTEISHLAEFGVIFLMFMIGVELSWERLRTLRRLVFGLGALQTGCSTLILGAILYGLDVPLTGAVIVGIGLALSSTAVVLPVLAEQRRLNTPTGRASFAVLLFQDLAVAPVLFAIAVLGRDTGGDKGLALALALGQAAVALVLIVVAGRLALRPLFHLVARTRSTELFMAACLLVIVATALTAAASGLSMTLGAFVAGLLLAETEYRRAIEATIDPFKGLLLGVFFVSVGMNLDPAQLMASPGAILGLSLALVLIKAAVVMMAAPVLNLPRPVALEAALLLGPGGEFAFVLIGGAMVTGLVPEEVGAAALIVTTVTMILIPALAAIGRHMARSASAAAKGRIEAEPLPEKVENRVIIAGYGRVGRQVGEMLARHRIPYLALDSDAARVAEQRRAGAPVYFGDSGNVEILRRSGIDTARALVVTLDTPAPWRRRSPPPAASGPTSPSSPGPGTPGTPPPSTNSGSTTRCRRRSRPPCNCRRRCWSMSVCRWASSSPRSTSAGTSTGPCSRSGRARRSRSSGRGARSARLCAPSRKSGSPPRARKKAAG